MIDRSNRSKFVGPFRVAIMMVAVSSCGGGGGGGGATSPPPPAPSPPESGAVYVFTGDAAPVFAQQAYIKASNPDDTDGIGLGVALSGDTLAVSAAFEDSNATGIDGDQSDNSSNRAGAAYVFTRDGAGVWSQRAYIKASNTGVTDEFGWSIALSGDTLAVGAIHEASDATGIDGDQSIDSARSAGAVYVFTRTAGVWSQQAYIKASNPAADDLFGWSLALEGDTLAVGAAEEDSATTGIDGDQSDNSANNAGAVYVFTRTAGLWSQQAYLKASNTGAGDRFGASVDLSGDTLAVAADNENSATTGIDGDQTDNGANNAGAVYVFTRTAGLWSQQAYIKASNTDAGDQFGFSVALSGDRLAVGAPYEDSNATGIDGDQSDNSAILAGAVYMFTRTAGVWSQQAYVKGSNTGASDQFGWSSALSGDRLAVGAAFEDSNATGIDGDQGDNSAAGAGAAYVFTRDGAGVWSQQHYVKGSNTDAGDWFGASVDLLGETLAVGAYLDDSASTGVAGDQGNNIAIVAISVVVGTDSNAINPDSKDVIAVAVLGSVNFDATQVDFSTAEFGPGKASPVHDGHVENVDDDDFLDVVFHFNTQDTGIACIDTEARLSGKTFGAEAFTGTYSVKTAGCR